MLLGGSAEDHKAVAISLCVVLVSEEPAGCAKRPSSKAAASEEARCTLRYIEPLNDARTPLADFFRILLKTPLDLSV